MLLLMDPLLLESIRIPLAVLLQNHTDLLQDCNLCEARSGCQIPAETCGTLLIETTVLTPILDRVCKMRSDLTDLNREDHTDSGTTKRNLASSEQESPLVLYPCKGAIGSGDCEQQVGS